jgi:DNA-binding transcriptional LysR family regulator
MRSAAGTMGLDCGNIREMDRFSAMQTFVSVIETSSFSAAARRMKVGQPAVSKSIAQLESKLGVPLFVRSTRGLTPTEAGQRFYERAKAALDAAEDAEVQARGTGKSLTGTLRVCAPVTFARLHIVPALTTFIAQHPEMHLDLVLTDRGIDMVAERIDVGLRLATLDDSGALTARKVAESPLRVLGTPAYFRRMGVPAAPPDLHAHEFVIYDQRAGGTQWSFQRDSSEIVITVSGRMRITAAEGVRAAVLAHAGVTVSSEWMFAPELKSGAVRAVLTEWTLPAMTLWTVFPAGRMISAKVRAFVSFVEQALAGPPAVAAPSVARFARGGLQRRRKSRSTT